jgi:hypothetical protein
MNPNYLKCSHKNASFESIEVLIRARTVVVCVREYGFVTGSVSQFSADFDPLLARCTDEIAEMVTLIIIIIHGPVFGRSILAERTNSNESSGAHPRKFIDKNFSF